MKETNTSSLLLCLSFSFLGDYPLVSVDPEAVAYMYGICDDQPNHPLHHQSVLHVLAGGSQHRGNGCITRSITGWRCELGV